MKLPEFAVARPTTVLMIFFAILLIGGFCLTQLPVDLLPEMDLPAISVVTTYPGAGAEDVETKVTELLEDRLATVPELKHITSTSKEGISVITLQFEWGTDLDTRANEVRDTIGFAEILLPDDADDPLVLKFDVSRFPIMVFGVRAEESYPRLKEIAEDEIADPLKRLPGVGGVIIRGALERQINIRFDRQRLASYGLTPQDIVRKVTNENETLPGGNIKQGLTDYLVRVPGEFKDVAPMRRIVLASQDGSVVRLGDVATVEDAYQEPTEYVRVNRQRGIILMLQKQSGANTVQVARRVHRRLEQVRKRLPPDVSITVAMDSSEDILRTIRDLTRTLLIGGGLSVLVVLVFLRRVRATFVIALTLPFSLILTFIGVFFLGYTINMMTLFGMTIGVGMVVDNAIVILENITRHREEGERPREAAVYGASEVAMAITASTLTTVCIFFPIIFVKGITRIIFAEFAVMVSIVLLGSLFSALTLTPMLSSKFLLKEGREARGGPLFRALGRAFDALSRFYGSLLGWTLRHRLVVVGGAVALFVGSLGLVPLIGSEFMPEEDVATLRGTLHLPVGTRVEETARVMARVDALVREEIDDSERVMCWWRCGQSQEGIASVFGEEGSHIGEFGVKLVPKVERGRVVKEIAAAVRRRLEAIRSVERIEKLRLETGDPMAGFILGGQQAVTVNIIGDDLEVTDRLAERIKGITQSIPGAVDVTVSRVKGKPELWVEVDRDRASALGLNVHDIADTVRASFYGREASKYRVHGEEYDIFVRLQEEDRDQFADLAETPVRLPAGGVVQVGNLADVGVRLGPVEIERKDQSRIVNVGAAVQKRSLGEVVADLEEKLEGIDVPRGVEIKMAGRTEEQRESFFWLRLALGVGLVLVYMVMASQFESLRDPFVIMFSVPFAFVGVIWAVFLGDHNLSVIVFIGLLMLVGIVVNNAIVLVDYTNILRARGVGLFEAVRQAGQTRLRPVLMTALTTIVALLPMAFTSGQSSEVWNPLGLTVLGGLLVSTLITLFLVPTLYTVFERRRALR
ncbi:MAG: efflux RND transporter permease subunit [Candidatus Brocadiia bacterium]